MHLRVNTQDLIKFPGYPVWTETANKKDSLTPFDAVNLKHQHREVTTGGKPEEMSFRNK